MPIFIFVGDFVGDFHFQRKRPQPDFDFGLGPMNDFPYLFKRPRMFWA